MFKFNNIGKTIRTLAEVICLIGIIISVISGFVLIEDSLLVGFLIIGVGVLVSWIGSLILYGFGLLVDNSVLILEQLWHINHLEDKSNDTDSNV